MSRGLVTLGIVFILGTFSAAQGATIHVPDNFPSIQDAISAASNGDTIVVRPGTYTENINFFGKAIALISEMGPAATVIDGGQAGSVVTFNWYEASDAVIEGFALTNGKGINNEGGGILCEDSAPTIRGNVIHNNDGRGIDCLPHATPDITDNTIRDNLGRGISCGSYADTTISGNRIVRNQGGLSLFNSWSTISGNIISGNSADNGGGIHAVFCGVLQITNNIITDNSANNNGGGIYCHDAADADLLNNTIHGNSAGTAGGGFFCSELSDPTAVNTIFWNNAAPTGPEIAISTYSSLAVSYCDVAGGQAQVDIDAGSTLNWGSGQIDADPLFASPAAGDFHLTWNSPCRAVGNAAEPLLPAEDFEGDPRALGGKVAIGADAFYFHLYHTGSAVPGGTINIHVAGGPGMPVVIAIGSGIMSKPLSCPCGDFYLKAPIVRIWNAGTIPASGILSLSLKVPGSPGAGKPFPMQALVRKVTGQPARLTNLLEIAID
jgi:parallel beta-helix repeat protein